MGVADSRGVGPPRSFEVCCTIQVAVTVFLY